MSNLLVSNDDFLNALWQELNVKCSMIRVEC